MKVERVWETAFIPIQITLENKLELNNLIEVLSIVRTDLRLVLFHTQSRLVDQLEEMLRRAR